MKKLLVFIIVILLSNNAKSAMNLSDIASELNPDAFLNEYFLQNRTPSDNQSPIDLSLFDIGIHSSVGLSFTESGLAPDLKLYIIETKVPNDPIKINIFGIGYSPDKNKKNCFTI